MKPDLTKKIMFVATLAYALSAVKLVHAQTGENLWRSELFYTSSRVVNGVERANASAVAALKFTRDQFSARLATAQSFDRDEAREYSTSLNYTRAASEALSFEFFAAHTWFEKVPGGGVKRAFETGVAATLANLAVAEFVPKLSYAHDFHFDADTTQVTFARSIALTKLGAFLEVNFFAGWSTGENWRPDAGLPARADSYGYWGGEVRLPYHIGRYALEVGLHCTTSEGRSLANGPFGTGSRENFWVTFGVTREF